MGSNPIPEAMQATLTFNFPDDEYSFRCALKGPEYECTLNEFDNWIRGELKYNGDKYTEEARATLQAARDKLYEIRKDRGTDESF